MAETISNSFRARQDRIFSSQVALAVTKWVWTWGSRAREAVWRNEAEMTLPVGMLVRVSAVFAWREANFSISAKASLAAASWAWRRRVSPSVTAMTETDFWALHWKSKNLTLFGLSRGVSFSVLSGTRLLRRFSKDLSLTLMSWSRPSLLAPSPTQLPITDSFSQ